MAIFFTGFYLLNRIFIFLFYDNSVTISSVNIVESVEVEFQVCAGAIVGRHIGCNVGPSLAVLAHIPSYLHVVRRRGDQEDTHEAGYSSENNQIMVFWTILFRGYKTNKEYIFIVSMWLVLFNRFHSSYFVPGTKKKSRPR